MKNTTLQHIPILAILALTSLTAEVSGAIVFSGDVSAGTGQFAFDEAFEMTITSASSSPGHSFVMNDFVTADSDFTAPTFSPSIFFTLNDELTSRFFSPGFIADSYRGNINDISFNDSLIAVSFGFAFSIGDVLRFPSQTFAMSQVTGFNPLLTGEFTGDFFLTDGNGRRVSSNAAIIPEPSSTGLLVGLMTLALVSHRRRIR